MSLDIVHFPDFGKSPFSSLLHDNTLKLLCRVRDEISCQHISYISRMARDEMVESVPSHCSIVLTFPTKWALRYIAKNYFSIDPLHQNDALFLHTDAVGTIHDLDLDVTKNPLLHDYLLDAQEHGLGNLFFAVTVSNAPGLPGCTLFTFKIDKADKDSFIQKMRSHLLNAATLIHNAFCANKELYDDMEKNNPNSIVGANVEAKGLLTRREIDCLRWASCGKTDNEIADILNIARWTVVTYLQNAKLKLGCPNRTSAVVAALSLGIIGMPDL